MFKHINKRALTAAAVIVTAGLPSAVAARPLVERPDRGGYDAAPVFRSVPAEPLPQAQQGFQWGDAGLGAAGMLVLLGAGSGAVVAVRRRSGGALLG